MSSIITVAGLAAELETTVGDIACRVSALCAELGPQKVVNTAVSNSAKCMLTSEAGDMIRAQIAEAA